VPSWWTMNTKTKGLAKGDLVFVFGEREGHTLKAQLVLFAAPTAATTPMAMPTAHAATTAPAATIAPAVTPKGVAATIFGTHS
jgi:hypothetical protein